jgi:hypothetical protein
MFGLFKDKPARGKGPDFSSVDSRSKAEKMCRQGDLEELFLIPPEFGGEDVPENVLYVPVGVAAIKSGIDINIIGPLVSEGKISQYNAEPDYQGESFVPTAIKITAWDPGQFSTTINIWGEALARDQG